MTRRPRISALAFALALGGLGTRAFADDHGGRAVPMLPRYQAECAACHVAYPPGLLPAQSWARIMAGLKQHFGTDASLDPASVTEISGWLAAHAGSRRSAGAGDRITTSPWFVREHREVPPAAWRLPAVNQPSNCAACHRGADQGAFDEHDVRIPR